MLTRVALVPFVYVAVCLPGLADEAHELATQAREEFSERASAASYSLFTTSSDYGVRIEKPAGAGHVPFEHELTFQVLKDGNSVFSWKGHHQTVFAVHGDVLYYAKFLPVATGCTVKAVDLLKGEELWSAPLQGLGPISHYRYFNRVNLRISRGYVCVAAQEALGSYGEVLDLKTGKTLANSRSAPR